MRCYCFRFYQRLPAFAAAALLLWHGLTGGAQEATGLDSATIAPSLSVQW